MANGGFGVGESVEIKMESPRRNIHFDDLAPVNDYAG